MGEPENLWLTLDMRLSISDTWRLISHTWVHMITSPQSDQSTWWSLKSTVKQDSCTKWQVYEFRTLYDAMLHTGPGPRITLVVEYVWPDQASYWTWKFKAETSKLCTGTCLMFNRTWDALFSWFIPSEFFFHTEVFLEDFPPPREYKCSK